MVRLLQTLLREEKGGAAGGEVAAVVLHPSRSPPRASRTPRTRSATRRGGAPSRGSRCASPSYPAFLRRVASLPPPPDARDRAPPTDAARRPHHRRLRLRGRRGHPGRPEDLPGVRRLRHHRRHRRHRPEHARRRAACTPSRWRRCAAQIDAVAEDLPPAAFKSGMLATARAGAQPWRRRSASTRCRNYVLDPVMVATSGDRLLARDAEATRPGVAPPARRRGHAQPRRGRDPRGLRRSDDRGGDAPRRARRWWSRGRARRCVKGGHLGTASSWTSSSTAGSWWEWRRPRIDTTSTHGTGLHPLRGDRRRPRPRAPPPHGGGGRARLRAARHPRRPGAGRTATGR